MFNVGAPEVLVILLVALIVLGPDKLPDAARQVGKYMGEFRRVSSGFQDELRNAMQEPVSTDGGGRKSDPVPKAAPPDTVKPVSQVLPDTPPAPASPPPESPPPDAPTSEAAAADPSSASLGGSDPEPGVPVTTGAEVATTPVDDHAGSDDEASAASLTEGDDRSGTDAG